MLPTVVPHSPESPQHRLAIQVYCLISPFSRAHQYLSQQKGRKIICEFIQNLFKNHLNLLFLTHAQIYYIVTKYYIVKHIKLMNLKIVIKHYYFYI